MARVRFWLSSQQFHNEDTQGRDEHRQSILPEPSEIDDDGVREGVFVRDVFVLNLQLNSVYKASHNPG